MGSERKAVMASLYKRGNPILRWMSLPNEPARLEAMDFATRYVAVAFRRGKGNRYWIGYSMNGRRIDRSLFTGNLRVARDMKRKIEYELAIGELHQASALPLVPLLEACCRHLEATRIYKSYKNDFSRLRVFFGPVCKALELSQPGPHCAGTKAKPLADRYAHAYVKVRLLEDVTPELINRFLSARIEHEGWSPETANRRQALIRPPGVNSVCS